MLCLLKPLKYPFLQCLTHDIEHTCAKIEGLAFSTTHYIKSISNFTVISANYLSKKEEEEVISAN